MKEIFSVTNNWLKRNKALLEIFCVTHNWLKRDKAFFNHHNRARSAELILAEPNPTLSRSAEPSPLAPFHTQHMRAKQNLIEIFPVTHNWLKCDKGFFAHPPPVRSAKLIPAEPSPTLSRLAEPSPLAPFQPSTANFIRALPSPAQPSSA